MAAPRCLTRRLPNKARLPDRFDRTPRSHPGRFCFTRSHRPTPWGAGGPPALPAAAALRLRAREEFPGPLRPPSVSGGGAAAAEAAAAAADLAARPPYGLAAAQLMAAPHRDEPQRGPEAALHQRADWEH